MVSTQKVYFPDEEMRMSEERTNDIHQAASIEEESDMNGANEAQEISDERGARRLVC